MHFNNMDFKVQGPQIHQFNSIQPRAVPRSSFKRDFTHRTTLDTDFLYPVYSEEVLPGDDIHIKMQALLRLTTPIKPIMDNLYCETFWFFVPFRLINPNWEKLQGQQTNPGDSVDYVMPKILFPAGHTTIPRGGVGDYLGMPTGVDFSTHNPNIMTAYHVAYRMCWNQWFRDENLLNSIPERNDGLDWSIDSLDDLQRRGKRKDYLTSCLPWPQKGDAITINVGGDAPLVFPNPAVKATANNPTFSIPGGATNFNLTGDGSVNGTVHTNVPSLTAGGIIRFGNQSGLAVDPTGAYADLASATGITINELRQAALYQQILELDARGGTRYVESLFSRFGVVSPDFRLQRPELIGVGHSNVNVYAVPQTAPTSVGDTPQGNLAAYGTSVIKGEHQARYAATEHGVILGLLHVRADITYQQGIERRFTRQHRLDFYEPMLNGLGEQAVLNKEIYAAGTTDDELPFGYQERFADYKVRQSMITGKFRSTDPQTLDVWHLSQKFDSLPILGHPDFIEEHVPMDRVVAVDTEPKFYCDMWFQQNHVRPMPINSSPGINIL